VKEHEATGTDILGRDVHVLATGSNISASVSGLPPVPVNSIITLLSQQCTAPLHTRARTYTPRLQQMKPLIFSTVYCNNNNNKQQHLYSTVWSKDEVYTKCRIVDACNFNQIQHIANK